MRFKFFLLFAFFTAGFYNTKAQTASDTTGCAPLNVTFNAPAGSTTYFWTFGNGNVSSNANPSASYSNPGTYIAEFRQVQGGPVIGQITIRVFPKPSLDITGDPTRGCRPLGVQFEELVVPQGTVQITGYQWTFGDGSPAMTQADPFHTYNLAGNFNVSLRIFTNYPTCDTTSTFNRFITVSEPAQAAIGTNPNPPVACDPPLTVNFTMALSGGVPPFSFAWDFGNGNTATGMTPPAQTYTQNGAYTVSLAVSDTLGCTNTVTRVVRVGSPLAEMAIPDTVCLNVPYTFGNNSDPGTYLWNFGPNANVTSSTQRTPGNITFLSPGNQTITLTVTASGGCTGTQTKVIYVQNPVLNATVTPNYSCSSPVTLQFSDNTSSAAEWIWTFSDGSTSSIQNPTFDWENLYTDQYSSLGLIQDSAFVTVITTAGCRDEGFINFEFFLPNAKLMPDIQHGCAPLSVLFSDSSISKENIISWTYLWDDGSPAQTVTNGNDISHTFTQPGEYNVRLVITNSAGCTDTSHAVLIEVGEPVIGDFSSDKTSVCIGDTVQFSAINNNPNIDAWHFYSDSDRLWHCFQDSTPRWVFGTEAGVFDVTLVVEYNGCFDTLTKSDFIEVKGPIAHGAYSTTCENTLRFDFENLSTGADKVTWYYKTDSSMMNNISVSYAQTGPKTVILKAESSTSGCPASFDTLTVYPTRLEAVFEIEDTLCGGTPYKLDCSDSKDVNAVCKKGITWFLTFDRPIGTEDFQSDIVVPTTGQHTVSLVVEDINGCKDTLERDFVAIELIPDFEMDKLVICNPGTVQFTDLSTAEIGLDTWEWDFGDGGISTDQNPTHTFTTPPPNGTKYLINLKVTDKKGCPQNITKELLWYVPQSNISSAPGPFICVGQSLALTATDFTQYGSNLTWNWNYSGQQQTGQTVTYTFPNPGLQIVSMNFTEIATGCMDTITFVVDVQDFPMAAFTSNPDLDGLLCTPVNIEFFQATQSATPTTATWFLGNGVSIVGDTASLAYEKGTYTVTMVATTSYGCTDTTRQSFQVVGPEGDFTLSASQICVGDEVTFTMIDTVDVGSWTWDFGDGSPLVTNQNPVIHRFTEYPPSGQILVQLNLSGQSSSCSVPVEKTISFSPINAAFATQSTSVCVGAPHIFINNSISADQASWDFGDGTTSNGFTNVSHVYNTAGTYNVRLIVTDQPLGCMDTITQSVVVSSTILLTTFGDTACTGTPATIGVLNPAPSWTYIWAPTAPIAAPQNAPVVNATVNSTTTFTVLVTDALGCTGSATAQVFIPGTYSGAMNLDTLVEEGVNITLPVTIVPGYTFVWDPSIEGLPNLTNVQQTDTINLTVTDPLGCVESNFQFIINVIPTRVVIPNAFVPESDKPENQVFRLKAKGDESLVAVEYLKIYNRWGNLVHETQGTVVTATWDGMSDGKISASDVYVYHAKVRYLTGKEEILKGEVTLVR